MYRVINLFVCLVLIFSLSVALALKAEAYSTATPTPVVIAAAEIEAQIFQAINQVREQNHLSPLLLAKDLGIVARFHSKDMAARDYFSHVSPEGDNMQKRIERAGITNWNRLAENLASNFGHADPVSVAIKGWLESPHHLQNILDTNVTETGIGVAVDNKGRVYLTQLFVKRKN